MSAVIKTAIKEGAFLNGDQKYAYSFLSSSSKKTAETAITECLLEAGTGSNIQDNVVKDTLETNIMSKSITKEEQGKLNERLLEAVKSNYLSAAKSAIEAGADVNIKCTVIGDTLLHCAVLEGDMRILNLLFEHNADMYIKNSRGDSPFALSLKWACIGKFEFMESFLLRGYVPSKDDFLYIPDEIKRMILEFRCMNLIQKVKINAMEKEAKSSYKDRDIIEF